MSIENKSKLTITKLLILFLFINCAIVELFTGYVTIKSIKLSSQANLSPDFTPLITLIGAVVGQVVGFIIYSIKSTKENTKNGIIYESAMRQFEQDKSNTETNKNSIQ